MLSQSYSAYRADRWLFENKVELAALSLDVYRGPNRPPLPKGWELFVDYRPPCPSDDNGYFGACYIKDFDNPPETPKVAFAHRGVDLSIAKDIIGAIEIALGQIPIQYNNAKKFVELTRMRLLAKYGDRILDEARFIQTGHSMGGVLADLITAKFQFPRYDGAITFENPGSKPMINKFIAEGELDKGAANYIMPRCHAVQADVNFINTCNEQVGYSWRLLDFPYNYKPNKVWPTVPPSGLYFMNGYYIVDYTIEQHEIGKIYRFLRSGGVIEKVERPFGFAKGYKAYLDWDERFEYWNKYSHITWLVHPEQWVKFKKNYEKFITWLENDVREKHKRLICLDQEQVEQKRVSKFGMFILPSEIDKADVSEEIICTKNRNSFQ